MIAICQKKKKDCIDETGFSNNSYILVNLNSSVMLHLVYVL